MLAAKESLDDVRQMVVGADQVVHALLRAGLDEDNGDDGEGDSDDRANNGEAAAVRLDGGGDDGHFGGSQCGVADGHQPLFVPTRDFLGGKSATRVF